MISRRFSAKFLVFALGPAVALVLAAETTLRFKYFFQHDRDWAYLITPFGAGARAAPDIYQYVGSNKKALTPPPTSAPPPIAATEDRRSEGVAPAASKPPAPASSSPSQPATSVPATGSPSGSAVDLVAEPVPPDRADKPDPVSPPAPQTAPTVVANAPSLQTAPGTVARTPTPLKVPAEAPNPPPPPTRPEAATQTPATNQQQVVFRWQKACVDEQVYSSELQKPMPRTWDEHCFRGDRVTTEKPPDEFRIFFLGGSTVEDAQSDAEMMTAQFKRAFKPAGESRRIAVVNAGKAGFDSQRVSLYWSDSIRPFSPDLVLYYEAWNEQPTNQQFADADDSIGRIQNRLHQTLYYRSMLYTYLVEKRAFLSVPDTRFWKIHPERLANNFQVLTEKVRLRRGRLVFVTQVVNWPRMWKGVDTFDERSVDGLLDRLRSDRTYKYDVMEISALNQRLAVARTVRLCRELQVPVINILDKIEGLGDAGRRELFMDLGHLSVKGDRVVGGLIAEGLMAGG